LGQNYNHWELDENIVELYETHPKHQIPKNLVSPPPSAKRKQIGPLEYILFHVIGYQKNSICTYVNCHLWPRLMAWA
jgi:hypothetical protein